MAPGWPPSILDLPALPAPPGAGQAGRAPQLRGGGAGGKERLEKSEEGQGVPAGVAAGGVRRRKMSAPKTGPVRQGSGTVEKGLEIPVDQVLTSDRRGDDMSRPRTT